MINKQELLEEIKKAENHLSNLKEALKKSDVIEIAADGAILVEGKKGYYIRGDGTIDRSGLTTDTKDIKYLTKYNTEQQAIDELLRREIHCYIRRRACELNDNNDWRKIYGKSQYSIFIKNNNMPEFGLNCNDTYSYLASYFDKKEHVQTVANELNDKYSPETIKRLYYAENK